LQPRQPDGDTRHVQEHQASDRAAQENSRSFFLLSSDVMAVSRLEASALPWQVSL
jgi:hypothetical protein